MKYERINLSDIDDIKELTSIAASCIEQGDFKKCQKLLAQRQLLLEEIFTKVSLDSTSLERQYCTDLAVFIEKKDQQAVLQCVNLKNSQKDKMMKQRKAVKAITHYAKVAK